MTTKAPKGGIKRFSVRWDGMTELAVMCPRPEGEWVYYEDAESELSALREKLDKAINLLGEVVFPGRPTSGPRTIVEAQEFLRECDEIKGGK